MAEGVRKVNEFITAAGRSLIITDLNVQATSVPNGTLFIDPTSGTFKLKLAGGVAWVDTTISNLVPLKSITAAYIADRTITNSKIALNGVLGENIKDAEITTAKLADLAITSGKIANNAIITEKIIDGAVTLAKLGALSVDATKLVDSAVSNAKIANDSISTVKIQNSAIIEGKLATSAVTTTKLADLTVTTAKIVDLVVTTEKINNLAITAEKLAALSVAESKIANAAVTTTKIADLAISTAKITDLAVTETKLAAASVSTAKIVDSAITTAKIANSAVSIIKLDSSTQTLINSSIRVDVNNSNTATVPGNLRVNGNITATGDITGVRLFGAVYNDLAEGYIPEETDIEPGDIVEVTCTGGVVKAGNLSKAVVGVISDCYAQCFGATSEEIASNEKTAVGLIGKVPVKIAGRASIGQSVVSCGNGIGMATDVRYPGTTIGKVIENKYTDGIGRVMCLIFPA